MNFFARFKKLFLILGFLAIIFIIGYLLWSLFFKTAPRLEGPSTIGTSTSSGGLPIIGEGSGQIITPGGPGELPINNGEITPIPGTGSPSGTISNPSDIALGGVTKTTTISQNPSLNLSVNSSGQVQYYDRLDEKFYKLNSDGTKTTLSDKVFHSVSNVVWSPTNDKAIIEYPDGSKISYNFNTQKQTTIPSHWQDFSFSNNGDKLLSESIGLNEEDSWLIVSSADGSQAQTLEKLGNQHPNAYPAWSPNDQIAALYTDGVDFSRQELFFIGFNGENFKSTVMEGRGLEFKWSTEGDRVLYSVYNSNTNYNPSLWLVDATSDTIGENRARLNLQTWASKCTFASNTEVYCAVPEQLEKGAGLFPELADKTKDNLYKIDLTTGSQKLIAIPDNYYNISQIVVGEDQDYLYFSDKFSGAIYQIQLR
jgi:hypothetical protein